PERGSYKEDWERAAKQKRRKKAKARKNAKKARMTTKKRLAKAKGSGLPQAKGLPKAHGLPRAKVTKEAIGSEEERERPFDEATRRDAERIAGFATAPVTAEREACGTIEPPEPTVRQPRTRPATT
ncbi:MAG: hypothetical protein HY517_02535, partial [Candidatus Aenigmarchaeota archaeon]|nr:hypothetical protein [Candidatus Aenigmarchaeota archaeon]